MSKNAYEIRLDVLKMAQDMLESKVSTKMDQARINQSTFSEVPSYTMDDLMATANSMYQFIETSNKTK